MTNKQQTEQLKEALYKYARAYGKSFETVYGEYTVARTLIDFGMLPLLLPENAMVLTKEELEHMVKAKIECINDMAIITRKETAKEIFGEIYKLLNSIKKQDYEDSLPYYCADVEEFDDKLYILAKQYGVEVEND